MKAYKSRLGNGYYLIDDVGVIYFLSSVGLVESSWNGATERLMKHVRLVGNNVRLK